MTRARPAIIVLLCLAVMALPVGGAHLHLCFDGQEPAASLHLADAGMHHHGGMDKPHHDADVDIDAHGLTKLDKSATASVAFLTAWLFLLPLPLVRARRAAARRSPRSRSRRYLRPLLRAPPR